MTDKHVLISDKLDRSQKGSRETLPALSSNSLDDMRRLNHDDCRGKHGIVEFGHLELTDEGNNKQPLDRRRTEIDKVEDAHNNQPPGNDKNPPGGDQHIPGDNGPEKPIEHRDPALDLAEKFAQPTAEKYGLEVEAVRNENGEIEYHYYVPKDGSHERQDVLCTTDRTPEDQLEQARDAEIARLEDQYHVDIHGAGYKVTHGDTELTSREPTFAELSALEAGLLHSQPSQLNADGSRTEVNFFDRPDDPDFHAIGFYKDNSINLIDIATGDHDAEKIIEHELGHHAQDEIGGYEGTINPALEQHYNEMGWTKADDGTYLLQGKDGSLYKPMDKGDRWVRTNIHGEYLDENGRVVPEDQAQTYTNEEMYKNARVPHVHPPMPATPNEHDAEAQAYFRHSRDFRTQLYETSPAMYAEEKRLDQEQIDRFYGVDENGVSKYIRNPDGYVVPNTPENRADVKFYELSLALSHGKFDHGLGSSDLKSDKDFLYTA